MGAEGKVRKERSGDVAGTELRQNKVEKSRLEVQRISPAYLTIQIQRKLWRKLFW